MVRITPTMPVLPPVYLLISILLMVGLHFGVPIGRWIRPPWTYMGIIVNVVCASLFRIHKTTIKPFKESSALSYLPASGSMASKLGIRLGSVMLRRQMERAAFV